MHLIQVLVFIAEVDMREGKAEAVADGLHIDFGGLHAALHSGHGHEQGREAAVATHTVGLREMLADYLIVYSLSFFI